MSEKNVLQNVPLLERERYLKDTAEKTEVFSYFKELDETERIAMLEESSRVSNEILDLQEAKRAAQKEYSTAIKALKIANVELLTDLKRNNKNITETVYLLKDDENERMNYLNWEGKQVYARPLQPGEKQLRIFKAS